MSHGTGSGYDYTSCSFWEELDDYDKENIAHYDGVMIETENGDELYLSMKELLDYLTLLQSRISSTNTELSNRIISLLDNYKTVYKKDL